MKNNVSVSSALDASISKNTKLLFVYRILNMGVSFSFVPLLIGYLDSKIYGVWLTILSITSWIGLFDIGIGNGLRNRLAENLSTGDIDTAKKHISTAFALLGTISAAAFILISLAAPFFAWHKVFNIDQETEKHLAIVVVVMVFSFIVNFLFTITNSIAYARQEASFAALKQLMFNVVLLTGSGLLVIGPRPGSLLKLSLVYAAAMVMVTAASTYMLFRRHYDLIPALSDISIRGSKDMMTLGGRFFLIQITSLIIFGTNNIIIAQVVGPREVTTYNITYNVLAVVLFLHSIIITPLWSGFTEAYVNGNFSWIKNKLKQLNRVTLILLLVILCIVAMFKIILKLWLNDISFYNFPLIAGLAFYVWTMIISGNYAYLLNGTGKISVTLIVCVFVALVNIPLAIFLSKYFNLGAFGVVLANIICLLPSVILGKIQTGLIIDKKASGLWNR